MHMHMHMYMCMCMCMYVLCMYDHTAASTFFGGEGVAATVFTASRPLRFAISSLSA